MSWSTGKEFVPAYPSSIKGSSINFISEFIVVCVPFTIKFPFIVVSLLL